MKNKMDSVWELWNIDSKKEFEQRFVVPLVFHQNVNKEIIGRFELVKKLIEYSYYDYQLLDAAYERCILSLELALNIRYSELEGNTFDGAGGLSSLLNWAQRNSLFEQEFKRIASFLHFRNHLGHLKQNQQLGILAVDLINSTIDVINGLYENIDLRKERKREVRKLKKLFRTYNEDGAILKVGAKKIIIFQSSLLWLENRLQPKTHFFLFFPIFDPTIRNNGIDISQPVFIEAIGWKRKTNEIAFGTDKNDNVVRIAQIEMAENRNKFSEWKLQLDDPDEWTKVEFEINYAIEQAKRKVIRDCNLKFYNNLNAC